MVGITLSEEDLGNEKRSVVDCSDPLVRIAACWPPAGTGRYSKNFHCTHTCKSWPQCGTRILLLQVHVYHRIVCACLTKNKKNTVIQCSWPSISGDMVFIVSSVVCVCVHVCVRKEEEEEEGGEEGGID